MVTKEFEKRDEYLAFVNDSGNRDRIRKVYLYWYEGRGKRTTKVLPGRHVTAHWEKLSLRDQLQQTFNMPRELREAFQKDYEENGGMSELEGTPEDAVIVVEYDETA